MTKIGVFDSGVGGKAIAEYLQRKFAGAKILRVDDRKNLPYGDKSSPEVQALTDRAIQPLLAAGCDVIVLACNTATAAAIEFLRVKYPAQPFIGLEPMVKPAAKHTKTGVIAICATPGTLASQRYQNLKRQYGRGLTILEPDCSNWAQMIEANQVDELIIRHTIDDALRDGADVIVLACTHYHWIRELIEKITTGRATILDPSAAIASQIRITLADD